jgi:hypothetical protein
MPRNNIAFLFTGFIIFINCELLYAQKETSGEKKDTLLWYTGKKINQNTLITDNGMKVVLDKRTGKVTTTFPAGKDPMQPIIDKLDNEEKDEDKLLEEAKSNEDGIKIYPIVKEAIRYYKKLNADTKENLSGKLYNVNSEPMSDEQKLAETQKNFCSFYKKDYELVIQYGKQCKAEKNFNLPVPPTADYFNCWVCDSNKQIEYDKKVHEYDSTFFSEGSAYVKKAMEILRGTELTFAAGTCNYLSTYNLQEAIYSIVFHDIYRVNDLWRKYHKDHQKLLPLIKTVLNAYRSAILIGAIVNDGDNSIIAEMSQEVQLFAGEMTYKLVHGHDYTLLPMIPFIIATYRDAALLGYNDNASVKTMEELLKATHFRLTIEVYTRVGKSQAHQVMSYHTDGHIIGEFDSTRCLRWLPAGIKGDKNMWLYTQLRQAEIISPAHYQYVGPHDFYLDFDLRTHICNNDKGNDTLYIQTTLIPGNKQLIYWNVEGKPTGAPFESFSGLKLFIDPKKSGMDMVSKYRSGEMQVDTKEIIANAEKAKQMALQMQQSGVNPREITNKLSGAFTNVSNSNGIFDRFSTQTAIFPVTIAKKKVLIDQTFNAKDFNPTAASQGIIEIGTVKIHLEHIDDDQ